MQMCAVFLAVCLSAVAARAQWTVTNLHPAGASQSQAFGVADGQQVGSVITNGVIRSSVWTGTAASWVSLHPFAMGSNGFGVSGGRQVGVAIVNGSHASLWAGSVASWVDLHPVGVGAAFSSAGGVFGGQQAGYVSIGGNNRASHWSGTAASWVDLHAFVPAVFTTSRAQGVWSDANFTYIAGFGFNAQTNRSEALLWTRANAACDPDFTCDGNVDQDDVGCMINVVAGNPGCECQDPDFNRDGNVDQDDVATLINVVAGGSCP